mmetsp:Transcript_14825/g.62569  ORF Transcript_14825/g.62569 Transcript_14825/m.62569 type:complete len:348 (+) Transcript_14825:3088-4131(+)
MPRRAREGYERVSRRLGVRHLRGVDGDDRGARAGVACQPHQGHREDEEEGAVRHRIRRPARALTPRGGVSARRRASRRRRDGDDVSSRRVAGDARRREPKRAAATRHRVEFHLRGVLRLPLQVDQVPQKRPRVGRRRVGGAAPRVFRRVSGGPGRDSRLGLGLDQELLRRVRARRGGHLAQVGRRQSGARRRAGAGGASCTKSGARGGVRARYFRARPRGRGRADARHLAVSRPRRAPGTRKGDAQPRRVDGCPRARRRACPGALPRGDKSAGALLRGRGGRVPLRVPKRRSRDPARRAGRRLGRGRGVGARDVPARVPHAQTQGARVADAVRVRARAGNRSFDFGK